METTEFKTLGDLLPKTWEGIEALIRSHLEKTEQFSKCESPIEHNFLHHFYKVESDNVSIKGQVNCQTNAGLFRMDFVLEANSRKIGLECDGKQFHDKQRDEIRDAAILETGFVEVIYRVPGKSLWFYPYEVLDLLRLKEPNLVSEHGNKLLDHILELDGSKREDSWDDDYIVRSLSEIEEKDDGESYDYDEDGRPKYTYKSPRLIAIKWTKKQKQV